MDNLLPHAFRVFLEDDAELDEPDDRSIIELFLGHPVPGGKHQ